MQAAVIYSFGPAGVLKIRERPHPHMGSEEVLIRVFAAGLNPVDTKIRAGTHISCKSMELPAILGKEISGRVVAVGDEVKELAPGDPVFAFLPANGGFATLAAAPSALVVKKPGNVPYEVAAAVSLAGLTAYQAIHEHLAISSGEHVLIQAAAGGVGHLAVQFAKMGGAYVSGTASAENQAFLRNTGVDQAIDYKAVPFEEKANGADAVLDAMGGEVLYRCISCVKPGGRVVCLPSSSKDDPKAIALARERNVHLVWPMMRSERDHLLLIGRLLAEGKLRVEISGTFSFAQIADAHRAVESQGTRGKNVVLIEENRGEA